MPVVWFHLSEGSATLEQETELLQRASAVYAQVLEAPMARVRAFVQRYPSAQVAVAGVPVSVNGLHAPLFEFFVLEGRPLAERQRLLSEFTELLVGLLGVRRDLVRGRCIRIDPDDWAIGGVPASGLRRDEIRARADAAQGSGHDTA